ncbi:topology modulation protein [Floricoccus penangensis]|uniref:topology modulation protein n=1 Tax=Floricoccus penangensis TaxID=1859475 RepID=UPI002040C11D|nr:topology modulation protein [Floricoccus penangensis]URZ87820.1 topology modulation protein [Floricoccus penangensis]
MKILLIGSPGSGKSTFASEIEQVSDIAILHLDRIWHTTDYSQEAEKWFVSEQEKFMTSHDSWIVDGNYFGSMDTRLKYADTVVLLNISKYKRVYRIIKRSIKRRLSKNSQADMASNFSEKFDREYFDFLKFAWNYDKNFESKEKELGIVNPIIIRNQKDKEKFIDRLLGNSRKKS